MQEKPPLRLTLADIAIERSGRQLAAHIDLTLTSGEALVVTGHNGAGKSTLLRAIAGLIPLAHGHITLDGLGEGEPLAIHAHYLGHDDACKAALTAGENLAFWAAMFGNKDGALEPEAALARLGLGHVIDLPVGYLSAGQKRRVALARLLVAHRPLWLLDEPTTALDSLAQAQFAELLRAHLAAGGIVVAATHAPLDVPARYLRLGGSTPAVTSPLA